MTDRDIRSCEAAIVRKQAEEALRASEAKVRRKLEAILDPEGDIGTLDLADIIDYQALQTMMEDFHQLMKISSAIIDTSGKVLVAVGWQDICTKFHRVHPDTLKNCLESDVILTGGMPAGTFKAYRCKNNMWDMVTPIDVGGRHLGNVFLGQFLYEDEIPDYELFRSQARHYGFDETKYLAALGHVPRWSRETVDAAMAFCSKLAGMISSLGYSGVKLARALSQKDAAIAEHKQAAEELRESEAKYRALIETTGTGYLILDGEGRVVDANEEYVRLSGHRDLREILGRSVVEWTAAYEKQKNAEALATCVRDGSIRNLALDYMDNAGRVTPVEVSATFEEATGKARMIAVVRDITERKRTEEESQRERAFLDRLVEAAPEGIAITDAQGRVMRVNVEFVRMFGYGADEAVGQYLDDLVAPPERREEAKALTRSAAQGEQTLLETVRCRKDGTLLDVSLVVAPILVAGKQEAGYGIYRDITKRKKAEKEKDALHAELVQSRKMEAIGQLAGGVAHDFNNMLTGILGNVAIMRSGLPPADALLENLDAVETAARQAADLTKGLLTFSHSSLVLPVPTNITAALDATLALLKQSLPATIDIVCDFEQKSWNVLVDQSQITQILLNLAVNARDAMGGKGALMICTRNVTIETPYVREHPYARMGEFVHLSVVDTGPGIPPEVMEHLFEPFYTTKPVGSGTGLGLSVVYGAVKQAGGWITAGSAKGTANSTPPIEQPCSGATFDVYLPRCLEEPRRSFAPLSSPVSADSGVVLVVEDEPVVRTVTRSLLTRSGYRVMTAANGSEAVDTVLQHPREIDLVLLDMTMPGMTASEVVQAIRALDPAVPILLNSGYTSSDAVKNMLKEGSVQGFL
ncbi:MAG: PocR ligand-binding domain-containing protein, partial [Caldisericota bacterium]|nr:PocR ligand-binding domain-containing protein [Caldisericota bacterium]